MLQSCPGSGREVRCLSSVRTSLPSLLERLRPCMSTRARSKETPAQSALLQTAPPRADDGIATPNPDTASGASCAPPAHTTSAHHPCLRLPYPHRLPRLHAVRNFQCEQALRQLQLVDGVRRRSHTLLLPRLHMGVLAPPLISVVETPRVVHFS